VQQLRERGEEAGGGVPVLAAVGPLQLEVVASRMKPEGSHTQCPHRPVCVHSQHSQNAALTAAVHYCVCCCCLHQV